MTDFYDLVDKSVCLLVQGMDQLSQKYFTVTDRFTVVGEKRRGRGGLGRCS